MVIYYTQTQRKTGHGSVQQLAGKYIVAVIHTGFFYSLQDVRNIIACDLVAQFTWQMKKETQFINGGDIQGPVSYIDHIGDVRWH